MEVELATSQLGFVQEDMDKDAKFSDSELVFYVKNVLKLSIQGDCRSYNELVSVIEHNQSLGIDEVAVLVTCLKALSGAVSCIHMVHHRRLINSISCMSLWNYETDVMDALVELLLSLASSGGQLDMCLSMLVDNFVPPHDPVRILNEPRARTRKSRVLERVHSTLKDIADLVPLSPMRLEEIVIKQMPTACSIVNTEVMVMYVENMLRLENGAIGKLVGGTMLLAVMDHLLDLDLKITCRDIPKDDFTRGTFDMEFEEFEGIGDDVKHESDKMRELLVLDNLLVLTFEHLKLCYKSGRLTQVFKILLRSFQTTVFTAYKSKFTQFVVFYACSLDPVKCGKKFATVLLNIFIYDIYPLRRMIAVAYLASYLSRAVFMSASFVATMLECLAKWCSDYCKNQDRALNPELHKVFYAGCQAIMYLLCFRMRSMVLIPRLKLQLRLLNLEEILMHPLSALKVCLPSIVKEFLHSVRETQLFVVPEKQEADELLESELSRAFGGVERLDMFFPFDPCLLRKSDSFITPNFVHWSMVKSTPDDDEEFSSDYDIAEVGADEGIDIVGGGRSFEAHPFDDEFGCSFDKMSVTPKEYLLHKCASRNFHMQMPSKIRPSTSPESL